MQKDKEASSKPLGYNALAIVVGSILFCLLPFIAPYLNR